METRPEPTIIGNCEGWTFIVGKNAKEHSPKNRTWAALPPNNKNLLTTYSQFKRLGSGQHVCELWTSCVHIAAFHMVDQFGRPYVKNSVLEPCILTKLQNLPETLVAENPISPNQIEGEKIRG
jgi:hypothetical protein